MACSTSAPRSLLLTALRNFVIDAHRARSVRPVTLDEARIAAEEERLVSTNGVEPDVMFDRRWALAQVDEALRRTEGHFVETGRAKHWELFETRVLRACRGASEPPPLAKLGPDLGFASAADAAAAVQTVRRFRHTQLRLVVGESVNDPSAAELEWNEIRGLLV